MSAPGVEDGSDDRWTPGELETILGQLAQSFIGGAPSAAQADPGLIVGPTVGESPEGTSRQVDTGVVVLDEGGLVASVDAAASRMFDRPPSEVLGRPLEALSPELGRRPIESLAGDLTGRQRDGRQFILEVSTSHLALAGGLLLAVVVRDVTALRQVEASRRKAEARYRALVEQIPAVTFMASLEGTSNEIYVGPQIEALLGFTQKEWLDDPVLWFRRLHQEDQERWNAEFTRGCATGGPFKAECRFIARDGRVVWVHGEARVVRDKEGRPLFLQGVAFDISEIKAAEQKMREAQDTVVRTERLAAVGQLAASVGHDLRNPLGAIRNAWFFIARKLGAQEMERVDRRLPAMAQIIDRELERCGKIVGELLDFARERPLHRVACPLGPLVNESFGLVVRPAPSIALVNRVPDDLPVPYLDVDQFRQILINLLQNAVEAVDANNGRVTVRAREEGQSIVMEVSDNGRGIPREILGKIFDPLFTTKLRGTGLGLAIVHTTIARHGGGVSVDSDKRRGTTFRLEFPLGEPSRSLAPINGGTADLRNP